MSSVIPFVPSKLPAHLRAAELSETAKALIGGGGGGGKRVSIKGGVFRLVVGGKEVTKIEDRHLDVVIVAAAPKVARTYYSSEFDDDAQPVAPTCWSPDGEKPSPDAKEKQASNCLQCPMNAKGSGKGDSKACRYSQRVAVVLANDIGGDVLQLSLPATSLFGKEDGDERPLQAYARWLAAQSISPDMLVTRMKFDTNAATPKLFFKPARWLDADEYATCQEQGASHDALQAITYTVAQQDNVKGAEPDEPFEQPAPKPVAKPAPKPAPKPVAKKAAPAPEPEVVEAEAEEVVEAAPAVREKSPPVKKAPSLADIVGDWDDED
jgi:hypothetical protein